MNDKLMFCTYSAETCPVAEKYQDSNKAKVFE